MTEEGLVALGGWIHVLIVAGKVLSGLSIFTLLWALWNTWRRKVFPPVSYGRISVSQRRLRVVWALILTGGFMIGVREDPLFVVTPTEDSAEESTGGPEEVYEGGGTIPSSEPPEGDLSGPPTEGLTKIISVDLPLPFYRFQRERRYIDDELVAEDIQEGFVIPGPFLSALLAYLVLVVWWNPDNRLAKRILRGRKWRDEDSA